MYHCVRISNPVPARIVLWSLETVNTQTTQTLLDHSTLPLLVVVVFEEIIVKAVVVGFEEIIVKGAGKFVL